MCRSNRLHTVHHDKLIRNRCATIPILPSPVPYSSVVAMMAKQLYVALSRATSPDNITVFFPTFQHEDETANVIETNLRANAEYSSIRNITRNMVFKQIMQ